MANSAGAKIIAQDNTRKYLSEVQRVEDWDYNFLPPPPGGIPSETFADALDLKLNGQSIKLKRYAPAHTDSDISVSFAEANVMHVADTFWNGVYPFIDYSTGGSIDGMIAACDANLAIATGDTIIIAGHGEPVSNKSELKAFRDMLVGVRENVAALKRQGRSRDETVAARPTAAFDAKFGDLGHRSRLFHPTRLRRGVILAPASEKRAGKGEAKGRLEGKVAVITGASTGIGLASAKRFAAEGAHVFLAGRRRPELDAAVAEDRRKSRGVQCDVSNLGDLDRLFAVVTTRPEQSTSCSPMRAGASSPRSERLPKTSSTEPSASMSKAPCSLSRRRCPFSRTAARSS